MKLYKIIYLLAFSAFLAGCNLLDDPAQYEKYSAGGNKAQVRINIGTHGSRTILPDFDWNFSKYIISAEPDVGNTKTPPDPVEISGDRTYGYIIVPYGEWIFTVTAYVNVGGVDYAAAKGSSQMSVDDSNYQWIEIAVITPELGGTGTFNSVVKYPSGGSALVKLEPYPLGSTAVIDNISVTSGVPDVRNVPSGIYFLTVTAESNGKTAIRSEIVHIYQQLTSTADYVFTKLDFGANSLNISGTVNILVNGQKPNNARIEISTGYGYYYVNVNFINNDGDGVWSANLNNLNGANTLRFEVRINNFIYKEISIPVPTDDITGLNLGSFAFNINPTPISPETWVDGDIAESNAENWYSINVTAGQTYYFWANTYWEGDGTKTIHGVYTNACYSNFNEINNWGGMEWDNPISFTAQTTGTVYLRVKSSYFYSGSYETGTYAIAYSTNPYWHNNDFNPPANTVPLNMNTWIDGELNSYNDTDWYSIDVISEQTYYFWWNDSDYGDKTANIDVSFYYSNSKKISGSWWGSGDCQWSFTADKNDTVYIRINPYRDGNGTYAVAYSTDSLWKTVNTAIPLNINTWTDGTLSSNNQNMYSIDVTSGQRYYFWYNDSVQGDGTKTARVYVEGTYSNGNHAFSGSSAWNSPDSFYANKDDTIYISVRRNGDRNGTYAIAYSTNSIWKNLSNAVSLSIDTWKNGTIISNGLDCYSITATEGQTYYFWLNNFYGDGAKTAKNTITAYYSDGSQIFSRSSAWNNPCSFTANKNDTVYINISPYERAGTYAIAYSANSGWHTNEFNAPANPTPLNMNTWIDGELNSYNDTDWYSINVTSGQRYYFYWNDSYNGDETKTADILVKAYYSDGTEIFNQDSAWNYPCSLNANKNDTVYIRISGTTGTYAIAYSTVYMWKYSGIAVPLNLNTWTDGTLYSYNDQNWYTIDVTAGQTYYIWWNDSNDGDGKTARVYVDGTYSNGDSAFYSWNSPRSFTANKTDTVYIRIRTDGSTGTYAVAYSTTNYKPTP